MAAFTVFTWDPRKAEANERKHGVGFEEATSAFLDEHALYMRDADTPAAEDRFILLARSLRLRALIVCYCYREEEHVVRIISARKASPGESARYFREVHH